MSFIPSELQEDKRRAENALGRITLSHPDDAKAILESLYGLAYSEGVQHG